MFRKPFLVAFVLMILFFVPATMAQEVEPSFPRVEFDTTLDFLINTFTALVLAAFGGAPVVVTVTALLKRVEAFDRYGADEISFTVSAVLYILALGASYIEMSDQFYGLLDMVVVVAPSIVAFLGTLGASPVLYTIAKELGIPVIGQSRNE